MPDVTGDDTFTFVVSVRDERCDVTLSKRSATVIVAQGKFRSRPIEARAASRSAALGRWRYLAEQLCD